LETCVIKREKQKPAGNASGFQKNVFAIIRSEIPPEHNEMPCDARRRGNRNHRLGRFHEHFDGMLR